MPRSEEPPTKRQRISQACETCRKRKSKCDGTQPRCNICKSYNRVCTYETSGRKRGLQSGYVRSLEAILGIFIQNSPQREDYIRSLLRSSFVADDILEPTLIETSTEVWHQSGLHNDVQKLLNAEDKNQARVESLPLITPRSPVSIVPSPVSSSPLTVVDQIEYSTGTNNLVALHISAIDLVEDYFHTIHYWFPIVERRDVLFTLHSNQEMQTMDVSQKGHRACLLAIQAVTLAHTNPCTNAQADLQRLLNRVRLELAESDNAYEIGHIQAALLLVLLYIGKHLLDTAWITLGQVSRMIQVHLQRSSKPATRMPHILRAYQILDTIVSIRLGKPWCSVLCAYQLEMNQNDIDEWEGWCPRRTSMHTSIQISKIPLRALSVFNLASEAMKLLRNAVEMSNSPSMIVNAVDCFERWYHNMPAYARLENDQVTSPCVLNLRLLYNYGILSIASIHPAQLRIVIMEAIQSSLTLLTKQMDDLCTRHLLSKLYLQQISEIMDRMSTGPDNDRTETSAILTQLMFDYDVHRICETTVDLQQTNQSLQSSTHIHNYDNCSKHNSLDHASNSSHPNGLALIDSSVVHNACTVAFPLPDLQSPTQSDHATQISIDKELGTNLGSSNGLTVLAEDDFEALMENDFDIMLQDMPLLPNNDTPSAQLKFAQNFGFLSESVNSDFLALLEDTGNAPIT